MRDVDLNLLRLLDALMEDRSVTKVGERLGVTQSAVSHGLRRLRETLGDPLFIRSPSGLQPTERMQAMAPALREGLNRVRSAVATPEFNPATSERHFTIAAVSYACGHLIPEVVERAGAAAPKVRLSILALPADLSEAVGGGAVDLAIGSFQDPPERFAFEPLFAQDSVWVVAAGHPMAGRKLRLEELFALPQVRINAAADLGGVRGWIVSTGIRQRIMLDYGDHFRAPGGLVPNVAADVYDLRTAIALVARGRLAAMMPRQVAMEAAASHELLILEPPKRSTVTMVAMLWNRELGTDPGRMWLRDVVRAASKGGHP